MATPTKDVEVDVVHTPDTTPTPTSTVSSSINSSSVRREMNLDKDSSLYDLPKDQSFTVSERLREVWRVELRTGERDPTLREFVTSPLKIQKICFNTLQWNKNSFNSQSTSY